MNKIYYTYNDIVKYTLNIKHQIDFDDYQPDMIVGIARGGAMPAMHLSYALNKPLKLISISTRDIFDESNDFDGKNFMGDKKILLVDDVCDSGKTFEIAKERFEAYHVDVRYASVFNKVNLNNFNLNYTGHNIIDDAWVVFPWDIKEGD